MKERNMSAQKERPILMSSVMVRAIIEGRKSQTRRVIKPQPTLPIMAGWILESTSKKRRRGDLMFYDSEPTATCNKTEYFRCPHGVPGDRLWVKETWAHNDCECEYPCRCPPYVYRSDDWARKADPEECPSWRSSRYMPRLASRITLEVTGVKVERVHEISEADAIAEGVGEFGEYVPEFDEHTPVKAFRALWDSINGKRGFGWAVNPWVWCVSFRRVTP